jgi:plasmid stabilization system protein ParE
VRALKYSKAARADLLAIARYSRERWGPRVAARYLSALRAACTDQLDTVTGPLRWGAYEAVSLGSHTIFFRRERGTVWVARVLHQKMLPALHLGDDENL